MSGRVKIGRFEWDPAKNSSNLTTHGIDFSDAILAFLDPKRIIAVDEAHSDAEARLFCIGLVGNRIATVRFTYRARMIRIIGAGYWRKGKRLYEKENGKIV